MKVYEAIEALYRCDQKNELVILKPTTGGIGCRAHDTIEEGIYDGFDWDQGRTFIIPKTKEKLK